MHEQHEPPRPARRPLAGDQGSEESFQRSRVLGLSAVRRWSNWSLAALVVGVAGGTAALTRTIPSHAAAPTASTPSATPGAGTAVPAAGAAAPAPTASRPVAVTSASGVTTYVPAGSPAAKAAKASGGRVATSTYHGDSAGGDT